VIFLPIKGGPVGTVTNWLAAQEGVPQDGLSSGLNQKDLRKWRRQHEGFKTICVVRHPAIRAHASFCKYIVSTKNGSYREMRKLLIKQFGVDVPKTDTGIEGYSLTTHKAAFIAFLKFLKLNLANQTSIRIDPAWASQTAILEGVSQILIPTHVIHEDDITVGIAHIEALLDLKAVPIADTAHSGPFVLAEFCDTEIEDLARDAYMRDYLNFGFAKRPY
jgi:hypothetical protein